MSKELQRALSGWARRRIATFHPPRSPLRRCSRGTTKYSHRLSLGGSPFAPPVAAATGEREENRPAVHCSKNPAFLNHPKEAAEAMPFYAQPTANQCLRHLANSYSDPYANTEGQQASQNYCQTHRPAHSSSHSHRIQTSTPKHFRPCRKDQTHWAFSWQRHASHSSCSLSPKPCREHSQRLPVLPNSPSLPRLHGPHTSIHLAEEAQTQTARPAPPLSD